MKGIIETQNTIRIDIDKPVYKSYVGIRDKFLKKNKLLIIRAHKLGENKYEYECQVKPNEWKKEAEVKPVVGLYADDPMKMYFNHVARFSKKKSEIKPDNKDTQVNFLNIFPQDEDFIKQARERIR